MSNTDNPRRYAFPVGQTTTDGRDLVAVDEPCATQKMELLSEAFARGGMDAYNEQMMILKRYPPVEVHDLDTNSPACRAAYKDFHKMLNECPVIRRAITGK